jgi:hypothetical protein
MALTEKEREALIVETLDAIATLAGALAAGRVKGPRYAALQLIKFNLHTVIGLVGNDRS